jgi:hypothetical protein
MRFAPTAAVVIALALAGCGDDPESEPLAPERAPSDGIQADGLSQDDAAMARTVARYFDRNGGALRDAIERVSVREGVITVHTSLVLTGRREGDARAICDLIQGSDEADFTPGHTVEGSGPEVTCRHRTQ